MVSAPPGLKTDRDNLIKDNLDRYCQIAVEMAKGKKERWCCREANAELSSEKLHVTIKL